MNPSRAIILLFVFAACSRPLQRARTQPTQPVSPAEEAAAARVANASCSGNWAWLFPGLGHLCTGRRDAGGALLATGAVELGTIIAVARHTEEGLAHPGAEITAIALQDLWVIGLIEPALDRNLARRQLYTPQDSTADLLAAPYNIQVLKRPEVWGGIAAMLALGVGVSLLVDESDSTDNFGADPNLFGYNADPYVGYPGAYAAGTALFYHVAIAEELLFRGYLQSTMASRSSELRGWASASLAFGAVHSFNAFALPPDERKEYLLYGVPFITAIGSYIGWVYQRDGYSLAPPVAIHFWYDFLLTATFFALDPQNSPISAGVRLAF